MAESGIAAGRSNGPGLWRQEGSLWCLEPSRHTLPGETGLIEFIGGSYLAATPQLSYRRLLEALRDETLPADELQRATYLTDLTESLP